ncbi:uncharacterized protein TRIADDRAFT_33687, partial [Trichoplax adhaerens]
GNDNYIHQGLKWMQDGFRKDSKGRLQSDPEYDSRTLWLPSGFLKEQTPLMRQWWQIKSENFDSVLCFKVGKFYEMYHMDALIGISELGLILMRVTQSSTAVAHCGFPEIAFSRYAETLAQRGYRVVRVEQTETPQMMEERVKSSTRPTKFDKVVNREVCGRITKATRTFSVQNYEDPNSENAFLLAIIERERDDLAVGHSLLGVCFLDTTIGKFHLGQFTDDRQCSRLRTLVTHFQPVQILYERGKVSSKLQHIFQHDLLSAMKDALAPGSEFWDSNNTLKILSEKSYFTKDGNEADDASLDTWPETLRNFVEGDGFGITAKEDYDLTVSALGASIWYLTKCFLDYDLMSLKNFEEYVPPDAPSPDRLVAGNILKHKHMILDAVTLINLDILPTASDSGLRGTLLEKLDYCVTPTGKRLFKHWLCTPLCDPVLINDRLDSVEDLMAMSSAVSDCLNTLRKIPDLEKLINKIHSLGSSRRSNHPDNKAIFFEDTAYSKRKILEFISVINGFKTLLQSIESLQTNRDKMKSRLLLQIITYTGENFSGIKGKFPQLLEYIQFFQKAFDHEQAKKDGKIIPKPGADPEYDDAIQSIAEIKQELEHYLDSQKKRLNCRNIRYWGQGRNRYQIEVPESVLSRYTPNDYELRSRKKGFKRFWTGDILNLIESLTNAEERRDAALKDAMRRIFLKFDEYYENWNVAIQCVAVLDALCSLASYSSSIESESCRPKVAFAGNNDEPYVEIRNGRHPCISQTFSGGDFIPNDTIIGIKDSNNCNETGNSVLVTGPNMGGKSTLMRQVGLLAIMAQLGCYVPATSCCLSPVDRLFTRLGASDRIMSGESTFFVELSETTTILRHATKHSLVLLDELGRGTATYDGTAIAGAVVSHLAHEIKCRTLFSTHYHSLVEDFVSDPNVRLGHMACMVENEDDDDPSKETITFLYKFVAGACPKSYGFNAARLAGLPDNVIVKAKRKAKEFESSAKKLHLFR